MQQNNSKKKALKANNESHASYLAIADMHAQIKAKFVETKEAFKQYAA